MVPSLSLLSSNTYANNTALPSQAPFCDQGSPCLMCFINSKEQAADSTQSNCLNCIWKDREIQRLQEEVMYFRLRFEQAVAQISLNKSKSQKHKRDLEPDSDDVREVNRSEKV